MKVDETAWISVQVTNELRRQVRIKAARKNISISAFVRQLLEELVKTEPEK